MPHYRNFGGNGEPASATNEVVTLVVAPNLAIQEIHRRPANETCHKPILWPVKQILRPIYLMQLTIFEHRHAVAKAHCFNWIVGYVDHCHAKLSLEQVQLTAQSVT